MKASKASPFTIGGDAVENCCLTPIFTAGADASRISEVAWGREFKRMLSQQESAGGAVSELAELTRTAIVEAQRGGQKLGWVREMLAQMRQMIGWLKSQVSTSEVRQQLELLTTEYERMVQMAENGESVFTGQKAAAEGAAALRERAARNAQKRRPVAAQSAERMGKLLVDLSLRNPKLFMFGPETSASNLPVLLDKLAPRYEARVRELSPSEIAGNGYLTDTLRENGADRIVRIEKEGTADYTDIYFRTAKKELVVNSSMQGRDGGGVYQAIYAYALNNGFKVEPDLGMSPSGKLRRTSHMLSSAVRFRTTKHLTPHADQGIVGWEEGDSVEITNRNIGRLWDAERRIVEERVPELRDFTYDLNSGTVRGDEGEISLRQFRETAEGMVRRIRPGSALWEVGIGERTIARSALASALREGADEGRFEDHDREQHGDRRSQWPWPGGDGVHEILYSSGPPIVDAGPGGFGFDEEGDGRGSDAENTAEQGDVKVTGEQGSTGRVDDSEKASQIQDGKPRDAFTGRHLVHSRPWGDIHPSDVGKWMQNAEGQRGIVERVAGEAVVARRVDGATLEMKRTDARVVPFAADSLALAEGERFEDKRFAKKPASLPAEVRAYQDAYYEAVRGRPQDLADLVAEAEQMARKYSAGKSFAIRPGEKVSRLRDTAIELRNDARRHEFIEEFSHWRMDYGDGFLRDRKRELKKLTKKANLSLPGRTCEEIAIKEYIVENSDAFGIEAVDVEFLKNNIKSLWKYGAEYY